MRYSPTGYSISWVGHICRKANATPRAYRDGRSVQAQRILTKLEGMIDQCRVMRGLRPIYRRRKCAV
jgi:hypothetical protein